MRRFSYSIALLLLCQPSLARADQLHELDWKRVSFPGHVVYSSLSKGATKRLLDDIFYVRAMHESLIPPAQSEYPNPVYIYLFKDSESFWSFARQGSPSVSWLSAGYSFRRRDAHYLVAWESDFYGTEGVLLHEYTHFLNEESLPTLPLWANDGMADVFFSMERDGEVVELGAPLRGRMVALHGDNPLDFEELMEITPSSEQYTSGEKRGSYYAQSWMLMHRLMIESPEFFRSFQEYCRALQKGTMPEEARQQFLPMLEEIFRTECPGEEWAEAVEPLRMEFSEVEPHQYQIRDMSTIEVLNNFGWLMVQLPETPHFDTRVYFSTVLKYDPENVFARLGLGRFHYRRGEYEEGRQEFTKALQLSPRNVFLLDTYAESELQHSDELLEADELWFAPAESEPDSVALVSLNQAKELFAASLEEDSLGVRASAGFALSHRRDPIISDETMAVLVRALEQRPHRVELLQVWCVFLARRGQHMFAWDELERRLEPFRSEIEWGEWNALRAAMVEAAILEALRSIERVGLEQGREVLTQVLHRRRDVQTRVAATLRILAHADSLGLKDPDGLEK